VFFKQSRRIAMRYIKAFVGFVFMFLAVILIVQNLEQLSKALTLRVNLLFWAHETPPMAFYLVIIIAFLLGIFIAGLYGIIERFKLKKKIRMLSKESREKDKELNSFRNIPVVESRMEDDEIEDKELVEGDQY
jgi:uncharacterized integral membrane protein